jgi:hypothetical protein
MKDPHYSFGFSKGNILETTMPCYFIDYPGQNSINPIDGRYLSFTYEEYKSGIKKESDAKYVKGIIPAGSKIEFLRVYSWSSYMTDTHIEYEGKIKDGEFKGKTANIDALIKAD